MKINKRIIFAILVCLVVISSCTTILSFHPLYTEDTLIRDDRIIGEWKTVDSGDTIIWEILFKDEKWKKKINNRYERGTKIPNRYTYTLYLYNSLAPDEITEFQLHILELDGKKYLDLFPDQWEANNQILNFHLMGMHTFAKVEVSDSITINWFNAEWFTEQFKKKKIRIKNEQNSTNILLTGKPKELQKFVIKYSEEEDAFSNDLQYILTKI